ncbi:MAG: hypothetical protein ACI8XB_002973 [Patiriisocius sp.]|jgi:hypothetical protein
MNVENRTAMIELIKKLMIVPFFVIGLSTFSFAQITKTEATAFINAHAPKEVQRITVVRLSVYVGDKYVNNGDSFEPSTTVITATVNSIHIKDGSGQEMYIPYLQIKSLSYAPESDKVYSNIKISVD